MCERLKKLERNGEKIKKKAPRSERKNVKEKKNKNKSTEPRGGPRVPAKLLARTCALAFPMNLSYVSVSICVIICSWIDTHSGVTGGECYYQLEGSDFKYICAQKCMKQ